jgi:membrane protease subunit (stomatin/prohibitin family)
MTGAFAESGVPFLDMAANQTELGVKIADGLKPQFAEMGLALDSFVVENLSLPEELQKMLDTRVGMNMIGDMGRYTQYQVANSMPIAAGNESGGIAGLGVGLGAGLTMANQMMNALNPNQQNPQPPAAPPGTAAPNSPAGPSPNTAGGGPPAVPGAETKFCVECGKSIPKRAKFCPECGGQQ